jgi:hypothetical protein
VSANVYVASVQGNPTPDELVAATVAVTAAVEAQLAAVAATAGERGAAPPDLLSAWVQASRRAAQRSTLQRGPWRLSGRIARRARI